MVKMTRRLLNLPTLPRPAPPLPTTRARGAAGFAADPAADILA
jgi:hypothetical protein